MLDRKLLRELSDAKGLLLAITSIIAVGVACYVSMQSAYNNLHLAKQRYYRQCRMADFWIDLKKAPLSAVERVAQLDGVETVQPRIVFDVILDLPGEMRPISGRLISTPAEHCDRSLNGICLMRGSGFSADRGTKRGMNSPETSSKR